MPQPSQNEVFGHARPEASNSDIGSLNFIISQVLLKIQTTTLVQVVSCTNDGGLSPVGFVDVQPMVHQLTGDMKTIPHGIIYNVPYFRLQGGSNAVIIDPQPGDIGMCGFCSRDISSVKKNKKPSAPPSLRRFDWSDGLYFGGVLNGTPSQFIRFHAGGIQMMSPGEISIIGSNISLVSSGNVGIIASGAVDSTSATFTASSTAPAEFTGGGGINADGDIKSGSISLVDHLHSGVTAGGSDTGKPK